MANFSFIDLFAGIGGFRLALEEAGGTCIGFSEIASDAIDSYCINFRESKNLNFGDITKIRELPKHDFMTAGVPCQSWSIAGKNLGFDDDRGQLWNDTLYLLNKVQPKVFIFENVKGLSDPRNKDALEYILNRIAQAGYYAKSFVLNAYDYGSPQTRVRIYIIGFKEKRFFDLFSLPEPIKDKVRLRDVLDYIPDFYQEYKEQKARWSLSCNEQGFNDYFLFNDLRNGTTTIHSWDIISTNEREKRICYLLLKNRRKHDYGEFDGNPLSFAHFQKLDASITYEELEGLVIKNILKRIEYLYKIQDYNQVLNAAAALILSLNKGGIINISQLKNNREVKKKKIKVSEILDHLKIQGIIKCVEIRYDFKNTKISTGLEGINRIILPSCKIYPTLVASDTNDYIATVPVVADTIESFRQAFMENVYKARKFRKITKSEACRIQGFPPDYILPENRPRWMKLIGNSVAVPVIKALVKGIVRTGVFEGQTKISSGYTSTRVKQLDFMDIFKQYSENPIVTNNITAEDNVGHYIVPSSDSHNVEVDCSKNVLIALVKKDNTRQFLDRSANIYYTGKKFPASIELNKLYYLLPYIKGKGIRDLYIIKEVRVGKYKGGKSYENPNDIRLIFDIEFVKQIFDDFKVVDLNIWHTFTNTSLRELGYSD